MLQIDNILFPRDFSECSDRAVAYALDLAQRTQATLHVLYAEVLHGDSFNPSAEPATSTQKLRERLKQATEEQGHGQYDPGSARIKHAVVRDIAAGSAILNYTEEHDIDVVVMGTHGRRGVRRMLLGSVAEEVVRESPCPVLTAGIREDVEEPAFRRLMVPVDFSEHSREALQYARELAALYEARLDLLHVVEETLHPAFYGPTVQSIYDAQPDIESRARAELKDLYASAGGPDVEAHFAALPGRAPRAIAEYADENEIDLTVIATHGRTGLDHYLVGSVTEKVVRMAPCPVFAVKSFGRSLLQPNAQAAASEGA